jgi:hypothetical protein
METFDTSARIAVLENEIKNIGEDVREIRKENREQHKALMDMISQMDNRLAVVENWRWMIIGGAAVTGFLVSHFLK